MTEEIIKKYFKSPTPAGKILLTLFYVRAFNKLSAIEQNKICPEKAAYDNLLSYMEEKNKIKSFREKWVYRYYLTGEGRKYATIIRRFVEND